MYRSTFPQLAAALALAYAAVLESAPAPRPVPASFHNDVLSVLRRNTTRQSLMKTQHAHYHTSEELQAEVVRLSNGCGGALKMHSMREKGQNDLEINVVTIKKPGSTPISKVFLAFGEHARELISSESGLVFMRALCGEVDVGPDLSVAAILQETEFQFVLNANPGSRLRVEAGEYCVRNNPNNVDMNRNWANDTNEGDYQGAHPFSEPETRILKEILMAYQPTAFLSIHSGTRGLYMPWAHDMYHLAKRNQPAMMKILKEIDRDHCQCPYGAAGSEVGYPAPGTSLDWAYTEPLKVSYSFAFEIYAEPDSEAYLSERWREKLRRGGASLLQSGSTLGHQHFASLFDEHHSDFVSPHKGESHADKQRRLRAAADAETNMMCFESYNPPEASEFHKVTKNWAKAFLHTSRLIAGDLKLHNGHAAELAREATPKRVNILKH